MKTTDKLYKLQITIFNYIIFFSYALFFIAFFGIWASAPNYLDDLQYWTKIYVSLFLIWRFNWFRKVQFTELDKKIAFSAGLFLLTTTFINKLLQDYLNTARQQISNYI